jgi:hypothetical protein
MLPSAQTAREILDLSRPTPQDLDYMTSLSPQQWLELDLYASQRYTTSSGSSVRDLAEGISDFEKRNRMSKELDYAFDAIRAEFDEHLHYDHPQEKEVDRKFQTSAANFSAKHGGPPSIELCRRGSKSLVKRIERLQVGLKWVILQHEDLISSRWRKKTKAEKAKVLLAAEPNMPKTPRPDMAPLLSRGGPTSIRDTRVGHSWPHINLEDLLLPNTFLIFINTRAHHFPGRFAYSDLQMDPLTKPRKEYLALRKDLFTMSFLHGESYENYAQLVEWGSLDEQHRSLRAGRTVHVEEGLRILLTQEYILKFLVRSAIHLVGDIVAPDLYSNAVPPPEPPALTYSTGNLSPLQIATREAPYRLPTELDLTRLEELALAQKRQAIEHAWALREDPSYFADAVEDHRNHRIELLPDLAGKAHPKARDFPLYAKVLRHLIMDSHYAVFLWDHVTKSLARLRNLSSKYAQVISVHCDLPAEMFDEITNIQYFLESSSIDLISMIKSYFRASPPLREHFYRANSEDEFFHVEPRHENYDKKDTQLSHLLCLIAMFGDKGSRGFFTLRVIMDEFETFMQSDAQSKALVSPFMASMISQLALIAECLHQFHCFQPWARQVENTISQHRVEFARRYSVFILSWSKIDLVHRSFERPVLCKLGSPRDGKFNYPVNERRTRANVGKMRSAEAALDKFWDVANAHWLREAGCTPGGLIKHIIGERVLHRTQAWVEPPKTTRDINSSFEGTAAILPFSGHLHDASKDVTGSFQKLSVAIRPKEKTHGDAEVKVEPVATTLADISPTAYTVDKRSFKVFRNLFHSPDSPDQPGQVVWTDFLHAMVSVGFATEKLWGSAWHFRPSTLAAERSIQFHEPHPGNKLPVAWARRYGRRLNRAFGWTADTFKLA